MESVRIKVSYKNKSERFYRKEQDFKKQYAHIYSSRLEKLGNLLKTKMLENFAISGITYPIKKISELDEDSPQKCVIIGTFFKDQVLKPSILKEISEDNQLAPLPPRSNYSDETDVLILEDELQRIRLEGNIDASSMITGIVAAVQGRDRYVEAAGSFTVEECFFYECGPEIPLKPIDNSPLVVFMTGLDLANTDDNTLALDLFQQWIYGNFEMNGTSSLNPSNVARVIIAGNSINASRPKQLKNASALTLRVVDTKDMLNGVKLLDNFVSNLSKSVEVDLMAGEFDPANMMLPQQPIHHCMFPKSAGNRAFNGVPNPYQFEIEGRLILGTAGQNIDDIVRFTTVQDPIECMKNTLRWSHIAPTCPDTLPCYPYASEDPFIISECPHVYFCAQNSPIFRTEIYQNSNNQNTRLICIPSFQKSQSVVVLNLRTLESQSISFSANSESEE